MTVSPTTTRAMMNTHHSKTAARLIRCQRARADEGLGDGDSAEAAVVLSVMQSSKSVLRKATCCYTGKDNPALCAIFHKDIYGNK